MKILNGICLVAVVVALLSPISGMAQDTRSDLASDIPEGYMPQGYDANGNYTGNSGTNAGGGDSASDKWWSVSVDGILEESKQEAQELAAESDELIGLHQEAVVEKQKALEQANAELAAAHEANRNSSSPETMQALIDASEKQHAAEAELKQAEADLAAVAADAEAARADVAAAEQMQLELQTNNSATMGSLEEMEALEQARQATQAANQRAASAEQNAQEANDAARTAQGYSQDQYQGMFGGLNLSDLVDNNYGNYKEMLGDTLVK